MTALGRPFRLGWLALAIALTSCGGGEEAEEADTAAADEAPAAPASSPSPAATPAAPADDDGLPPEWRSIREATLQAFDPCMAEIEAGGPGPACVRYNELVVLFHQAEAFRLYECRDEEAGAAACRAGPADPVRQSEYEQAVNPGTAPQPVEGPGSPLDSGDASEPSDPSEADAEA